MRAVGIVCEYNPFHRGHALHLARAREAAGADYAVCVMSGALTQRGVFARHDKWTRARAALECGADLVLELPARFACAPAPEFAAGGAAMLAGLGVVTHWAFGCEPEALACLADAAQVLQSEPPAFRAALRAGLDSGLSYPRARALAAQQALARPGLADAMALPNAALALEYLRAMPGGVTPLPILREGAGYHDGTLCALASASAVRAALERGETQAALSALPCPERFAEAEARGDVHESEALTQALLYRLRTAPPEALAQLSGMGEGLEHAFAAAAGRVHTRDALILSVKSKRYTYARLSRICSMALLGVTREFAERHAEPACARVLGFRRDAQPLLAAIKRQGTLPLVTKVLRRADDPLIALDVAAQDLWSLGCTNPALRQTGRDFSTAPVIV